MQTNETNLAVILEQHPNLTDCGEGRQYGSKNKIALKTLYAVQAVYDEMGGAAGLFAWANENQFNRRDFYCKIWARMLPKNIDYNLTEKDKGLIIRMFTGQAAPAEIVDQAAKTPVEPEISKTYGSPIPGTDKTPQKSTPEQIENNAPIQENQQAKNEIDAK